MRIRNVARVVARVSWLAIGVMVAFASPASAQDRLGGHFGFVLPLVTHADGATTTISDDFVIGFPMGITVKKTDKVAFDLELVPFIQNEPLNISLLVHPGVIFPLEHGLAAGIRMAFDVNAASWGFTPLLNKSFPLKGGCAFFTEVVLPIRFQEAADGHGFTAVTLAAHFGLGF